ncbi:ribonuclease III [bacterium]|nr:ribonuclease III [bacterium]
MKKNIPSIEKRIDYHFKNNNLLLQALTHSSYAYEHKEENLSDNEVLEFLGDSVLELVVADYLFTHFPHLSEGDLSKLKSIVANTNTLSQFAKKNKLDKHLLLGKGEQKNKGSHKKTILAGAFEALIAAIYRDGGFESAKKFIINHLNSFFKKIKVENFLINNYKSALQEFLQKENRSTPVYKTVKSKGPNHKKSFVVEVFSDKHSLARASGNSKKDAEQKAAQKALKNLMGNGLKSLTSDTFIIKKKT